jgi:hypothetical protein
MADATATTPTPAAPTRSARGLHIGFAAAVFALLVVPTIGLAWAPTETTTENRTLTAFPALRGEDGLNVNYLGDLGAWFEDHFAYRNEAVTANARLRADLFGVSATDEVVVGTDGWLYYGGTLNDFLGTAPLSDRALRNIAHNLFLMKMYADSQGARFAFTIAPNKNSLYPEHMPGYYRRSMAPSNVERLIPYLEEFEVAYIDLFDVLRHTEPPDDNDSLYLRRDTHWNNVGAYAAYVAITEALELAPAPIPEWSTRGDVIGDLEAMLFPTGSSPESQYYVTGVDDGPGLTGPAWSYRNGATTVSAGTIQTRGQGEGRLLVYRDSFGNALLPYLATGTAEATFSKLVPYSADTIAEEGPGYVLVERAERHLNYLADNAPIMRSPTFPLDVTGAQTDAAASSNTTCIRDDSGPIPSLSGSIDPRLLTVDATVYVAVPKPDGTTPIYETFMVRTVDGSDNGYLAHIEPEDLPAEEAGLTITVYVARGDTVKAVLEVQC